MGIRRNAELLHTLEALVPGFQPFDNAGKLTFGSFKVHTQLTPKHHFQVTYQRDANREESNFQVGWSEVDTGTEVELGLPARIAYATSRRRSWWSRLLTPKTFESDEDAS
jgi:hypothetical protein